MKTLNTTAILADAKLNAETWNQQVKIGDLVTFRDDNGEAHVTRTRTEASVLGGHTAVVWIEGKAGCVNLNRVTPIDCYTEPKVER
jgi:hypothetical protein